MLFCLNDSTALLYESQVDLYFILGAQNLGERESHVLLNSLSGFVTWPKLYDQMIQYSITQSIPINKRV